MRLGLLLALFSGAIFSGNAHFEMHGRLPASEKYDVVKSRAIKYVDEKNYSELAHLKDINLKKAALVGNQTSLIGNDRQFFSTKSITKKFEREEKRTSLLKFQQNISLYVKGVKNKKTDKLISVVCGQMDLTENDCQFVKISESDPTIPLEVLANGLTFSKKIVDNILNNVLREKIRTPGKQTYFLDKEFFVNAEYALRRLYKNKPSERVYVTCGKTCTLETLVRSDNYWVEYWIENAVGNAVFKNRTEAELVLDLYLYKSNHTYFIDIINDSLLFSDIFNSYKAKKFMKETITLSDKFFKEYESIINNFTSNMPCGLNGSIKERIADCPQRLRQNQNGHALVTRTKGKIEIYKDLETGLLWSNPFSYDLSQREAEKICSSNLIEKETNLKDNSWKLPSVNELDTALNSKFYQSLPFQGYSIWTSSLSKNEVEAYSLGGSNGLYSLIERDNKTSESVYMSLRCVSSRPH